jgi:hypothetical protein
MKVNLERQRNEALAAPEGGGSPPIEQRVAAADPDAVGALCTALYPPLAAIANRNEALGEQSCSSRSAALTPMSQDSTSGAITRHPAHNLFHR